MDQISEECDLQLKRRARKGVNRPVKSREQRERRRGDVKRRQGDVKQRETAARRKLYSEAYA